MSDIIVDLDLRSYKIVVKSGALKSFPSYLNPHDNIKNFVLISHDSIMKHHGFNLKNNLEIFNVSSNARKVKVSLSCKFTF